MRPIPVQLHPRLRCRRDNRLRAAFMDATHVYHGIKIPGRRSKFSAWWMGDPRGPMSGLAYIVDGERRDAAGRSYPLTAAEIAALEHGPWSARSAAEFRLAP